MSVVCRHTLVQTAFERSKRDIRPRELKLIGKLSGGLPYFVQLAGYQVWKGIDEGWDDTEITGYFVTEAEVIFRELWQRETVPHQHAFLYDLLGVRVANLSQNERDTTENKLKDRGILRPDGTIFSDVYADFIRRLSR